MKPILIKLLRRMEKVNRRIMFRTEELRRERAAILRARSAVR